LESLYAEAADLPPEEQAYFIQRLSSADPVLADEMHSLLAHTRTAGERLRGILDRATAPAEQGPWLGQTFGRYRVVRTIATGGMGTVFEAVREQDYRKRVALKVAASPIGTPAWVERFQQERQILAGLDHPHIARFLDGGASSRGLPYFAMELVEGVPITDYVRSRKASLQERIELFRKVCAAVSYAHQNLIVHRDLKPGNILVTADGNPKLLDFGIAKLLSPVDSSLHLTQTALPLLTPSYCSPEQVTGGKITTRVDVYLLGLILFELLTDEPAHELASSAPAALERLVCAEHEPVPSARAAQAGKRTLAKSLRGDLDTIAAKALQKDPALRYASVDLLSEDLARFLDGRPLIARPWHWRYRAGKFVRRHWVPVTASAAVLVALIAGAVAFAWQARIAERRFDLARKLANALLFDIHDKVQTMPGAIALREQISSTAVQYLDALAKEAGRNYALRRELAAGYLRLASAEFDGGRAAPASGGRSSLSSLNSGIALLEGMPASELAAAASTEAHLREQRGDVLTETWQLEGARADLERALELSPCDPQHTALCQNRMLALAELVNADIPPRKWQDCERGLAEMRRAAEIWRQAGGEAVYQTTMLTAGILEMMIAGAQDNAVKALEFARRVQPIAQRVAAEPQLDAPVLLKLCKYYAFFARHMKQAGQGTARERTELERSARDFALRRAQLDAGDVRAQLSLADSTLELAHDSEESAPAEAASLYREGIASFARNPGVFANELPPRIEIYTGGESALRFFLRRGRSGEAIGYARQITALICPALFLKLPMPRSEAAQRTQALWWTASEAAQVKAKSAGELWLAACHAAQDGLARGPSDPAMKASAALAFDGQADWVPATSAQGQIWRGKAHELWAQLSAAFPDNEFIQSRAGGRRDQHGLP
jgi:tetratricopeptide (TPR) repeat protein